MDEQPSLSVIRIIRKGPVMCALLGPDLQEGESEFEVIIHPRGEAEEILAGEHAAQSLENRLGIAHLRLPRVRESRDEHFADDWKQ